MVNLNKQKRKQSLLAPSFEESEQLEYHGANFFRQRLVLSMITGRPVCIKDIRLQHDKPGLNDYETSLLNLFYLISNGTHSKINRTGTDVIFTPGILHGGDMSIFECPTSRCISYYVEPLLMLGPFCKTQLEIELTGVTNNQFESSIDAIKLSWLPLMRRFIDNDDTLKIEIIKRGYLPNGGGAVKISVPVCKKLRPISITSLPRVRRIRGIAHGAKINPTMLKRLMRSASDDLRSYLADIYIGIDYKKGITGGNSPGFGLVVRADTTDASSVYTAEAMSNPRIEMKIDEPKSSNVLQENDSNPQPSVPEDLGREAVANLLDEIYRGGCVDSKAQALLILFMTMAPPNLSECLTGPLSDYAIEMLRHIYDFCKVKFQIAQYKIPEISDENEKHETEKEQLQMGSQNKVLLKCIGVGYTNIAKVTL